MIKYLIINGPNLNLLGKREPNIYGYDSLADLESWLNNQDTFSEIYFTWYQSNHEGKLIDKIHSAHNKFDGIILNPGALTHYSYALRDAIAFLKIPTVEVHISDIYNREEFRKKSVIKDVCIGQISGLGKTGYLNAVKMLSVYKAKRENF